MENEGSLKNRKVLPRWREIGRIKSSELLSSKNLTPATKPADDSLAFYYQKWVQNPTIENASEVIDVALLSKEVALAFGPAEQLLQSKDVLPAVKAVAQRVRYGVPNNKESDDFDFSSVEHVRLQVSKKIKLIKGRAIDEPRNAFLWLEMARLNAWIGHNDKAEVALRRAFGAAPENRIVLRALARFFNHIDKTDEALQKIRRSEVVKSDPWVQAAEIALSGILEKSPHSVKYGRSNLERGHLSPFNLSELASGLATEELMAGKKKTAKALFKDSLVDPTENSVAQAIWAKDKISLAVDDNKLLAERAFEARTTTAIFEGRYEEALKHCAMWNSDEPFLVRPALEGSHIAIMYLDDYRSALQFILQGLSVNPHSFSLRNNETVAYARAGLIDKARDTFSHIMNFIKGDNPEPVALATKGLIEFRSGDWSQGRTYYERCIDQAIRRKDINTAFRAKFYWLNEEVAAGTLDIQTMQTFIKMLNEEAGGLGSQLASSTRSQWTWMNSHIEGRIQSNQAKRILSAPAPVMKEISE